MPLIDLSGRPVSSQGRPDGGPQSNAEANSHASPYVKDSNTDNFAADVLQVSEQTPVIVDFWAPWCGPCKTLGPMLEKAVGEAGGKVRMVKINIDENQELARQLRIQSIPTVYAFRNGQPVDGFMGAIPESQIRVFMQSLLGEAGAAPDIEGAMAMAEEALKANDIGGAAQVFAQILQEEPGHPKAVAGLARCYLMSGDLERAKNTLKLVKPDGAADEAIRSVEAELALKEKAERAGGELSSLSARVDADPADLAARYEYALALDGADKRGEAIDQLLEIVRRERKWNEDAARKHLVTLFDAMGPADPRTADARRRLSALLFS